MEEEKELPTCFVIQPFDGGTFDMRYRETIKPALEEAGVDPKRADEILGLTPVIEKIETAIRSAPICVAEVTNDNPNVWLELGYALALDRPTVILCEKAVRPKLPFDVQHRSVIFYRTDSQSGFEELRKNIVRLVKHELASERKIQKAPVLKIGDVDKVDLKEFEVAILTTIFTFSTSMTGGVQSYELEQKVKAMGYEDLAVALGITTLRDRELISESVEWIEDGSYSYEAKIYRVEPTGVEWIKSNQDSLEIMAPPRVAPRKAENTTKSAATFDDFDDDIPF